MNLPFNLYMTNVTKIKHDTFSYEKTTYEDKQFVQKKNVHNIYLREKEEPFR